MTSHSEKPIYIYQLKFDVKIKLCEILDGDGSWEELAGHLGYEEKINLFRSRENSPSKALFQLWAARNGTIDVLFCTLKKMHHYRAMHLLLPYTSEKYHHYLQNEHQRLGDSKMISQKSLSHHPFQSYNGFSKLNMPSTSIHSKLQSLSSQAAAASPNAFQNSNKKFMPDSSNIKAPTSEESKGCHLTPKYKGFHENHCGQHAAPFQEAACGGACGMNEESITDNCAYNNEYKHKKQLSLEIKKGNLPHLAAAVQESNIKDLQKKINTGIEKSISVNSSLLEGLDPSVVQVRYKDILEATDNFNEDRILGRGGFGTVYKAEWKGTMVAIKRLYPRDGKDDKQKQQVSIKQSLNEMNILSRARIDNILPLYGVSMEPGKEPCLMYMYMPNGSLEDRLLRKKKTPPLTWKQRQRIAEGTARGLNYLHTFAEKPLVHGDIKSANILLDTNMEPKIGDFGLAQEGPTSDCTHKKVSSIHGTQVYLPDEYLRGHKLSPKVDVYSYGVVLLEICTGLRAIDNKRETSKLLVHYVKDHEKTNTVDTLRDPKAGEEGSTWFDLLMKIGIKCVNQLKKHRPEMGEVLQTFEHIRETSNIEEKVRKFSLETPQLTRDTAQQLSPMELQVIYDIRNAQPQQLTQASNTMNQIRYVRAPPDTQSYFEWPQTPASSIAAGILPSSLLAGIRAPPSDYPSLKQSVENRQHEPDINTSASSVAAIMGSSDRNLSVSQVPPESDAGINSECSVAVSDMSNPCSIPLLTALGAGISVDHLDNDQRINISLGSDFSSADIANTTNSESEGNVAQNCQVPINDNFFYLKN